jgi:hypothetical protein
MPSASEEKDLECALSDSFAPLTSHTIKTQSRCPCFLQIAVSPRNSANGLSPFVISPSSSVTCGAN